MATLVRASRKRLYDALTQAEHLDAWFTTGAEIDATPGGMVRWRWVDWRPTLLKFYVEHGLRY